MRDIPLPLLILARFRSAFSLYSSRLLPSLSCATLVSFTCPDNNSNNGPSTLPFSLGFTCPLSSSTRFERWKEDSYRNHTTQRVIESLAESRFCVSNIWAVIWGNEKKINANALVLNRNLVRFSRSTECITKSINLFHYSQCEYTIAWAVRAKICILTAADDD